MNIRQILGTTSGFKRFIYLAVTVVSAGLFNAQAQADVPVPNYDPADVPSNAYSFTLEGCKLPDDSAGYAPPGDFVCDDGDYTTGNLGKNWEELDYVPHRLTSDSSGAAGQETFEMVVGADNLIDDGTPGAIGYDVIGLFTLDTALSDSASDCQLTLKGGNSFGDFGLGGSIEQIAQVVEITQNPDTVCVWNFVERLAVTASNIPGSSNRSFIVAGSGEKSVPLPSDISPVLMGDTMSAVVDSVRLWTIAKEATPVNYDFGNTCDTNVPNTKDVDIEITYTKGVAEPSALTTTSVVQLTNPSHLEVTLDCDVELFGVVSPSLLEISLGTLSDSFTIQPNSTQSFDFVISGLATALKLRSHATCEVKVLDPITMQLVTVATLESDFSLADLDIGVGLEVNDQVVVSDTENISGLGFSFTTGNPTGTTGSFDGYTPGDAVPTDYAGPVLWNSDPQSDSGTVVFTKTVTVDRFKDNLSGTLTDTASLDLTDTIDVEATATTTFSASALVNLTIDKTIPDVLQGDETIDCNFTVKDSNDVVVAEPLISFAAGEFNKAVTITDLSPDTYTVVEGECGGLVDTVGTNRTVDLTLAEATSAEDCSATATYNNVFAEGPAIAQVNKVTEPAGLEDGWVMTLHGDPLVGSDFEIELTTADGDPLAYESFVESGITPFELPEGSYTVTETHKTGWENETASVGCSFSVDYPADLGKVFQCQFTNKQEGKIIIVKETDPDGGTDFGFTGDLDAFTLDDDEEKVVTKVAGSYDVTEDDPTPGYDLTDITCVDDYDENGYNVIDSDDTNEATRTAIVNLDPGETVRCVFTNVQRGEVELIKLTDGVDDATQPWSFTLSGPEVNAVDSLPNPIDFGGVKLIPGEVYTLCETAVPAGWAIEWSVFVGGNYVLLPAANPPGDKTLNNVGGQMVSDVYDPDANDADASNEDYCVDFEVAAGQTLAFRINDVPPPTPEGDQRTIGYWKNWTTCDGKGNQAAHAAASGGSAAGFWLLDDVLPLNIALGGFSIQTCQQGVSILDKRDIVTGQKRAGDAAYGLAAQLTAAMANVVAGAGTCPASTQAIADARALLGSINFNGTGSYFQTNTKLAGGKKKGGPGNVQVMVVADKTTANQLAGILDAYNNGQLCP